MIKSTQPDWNPEDRPASLLAYAEWLHAEAREMFDQDGTHAHILFLFSDDGLASMNPIPPNTDEAQITAGVRQSVAENDLYGVISIAEAWTYFPQNARDHIAVQLLHNEMNVSDLKAEHKTEALMLRMESRDGDHLTWVDEIVRNGDSAKLGAGKVLPRKACLKLESYFG